MVDAESRRFTSPFFHRQFAEKREIWTRVEDLRCYGLLGMFSYCKNLNLDCSDWNVPTYANHSDFNHCAPGVILPKAWQ